MRDGITRAPCSALGQDDDSRLDALRATVSRGTRSSARRSAPASAEGRVRGGARAAREVTAHAPHRRIIFTGYGMKRLGRDAAELTALADPLTAHGLVLEMLAGPLPGIYGPTGPASCCSRSSRRWRRPSGRASGSRRWRGSTPRPARASTAADPRSSPPTCSRPCSAAARAASPSSRSSPDLIIPTGKRKEQNPSVASIYRALAEHAERESPPGTTRSPSSRKTTGTPPTTRSSPMPTPVWLSSSADRSRATATTARHGSHPERRTPSAGPP